MQKYQNNVQTLDGRAIVGASVTVTQYPSGAPATVYNSNGSGVITQPILTNGDGEFAFYAANGRYQLQVTGGGISVAQTITDIVLFDSSDGVISSDIKYTAPFAGSVEQTQNSVNAQFVSVKNFGAIGNGSADDSASVITAWAYAIATGKNLWFPAGTYNLATISESLGVASGMAVYGDGMDNTIIKFNNTTGLNLIYRAPNLARLSNVEFRDLCIDGGHGEAGNYAQVNSYPFLVYNIDNLHFRRVKVTRSRVMGIAIRRCNSVQVSDCVVQYCARDGISSTASTAVSYVGNLVEYCDDDALTCHTDSLSPVGDRQFTCVGNTIRFGQGIKALGVRSALISGNTIEFFMANGISVTTQSVSDGKAEGLSSSTGVVITGNVLKNGIDRTSVDGLSAGAPYITISGVAAQAGGLAAIPGENDTGSGTIIALYPYFSNIKGGVTSDPVPPSYNLVVSNNTCVRDIAASGLLSDLGFGMFYTRTGPKDVTLNNSALLEDGLVILNGIMKNMIAIGNTFMGIRNCILGGNQCKIVNGIVANNTFFDVSSGVAFDASNTQYHTLAIFDNTFDIDPLFTSTNRGLNGTWLADGSPTAIIMQNARGLIVRGNTFKNTCRIIDQSIHSSANLRGDLFMLDGNIVEGVPAVVGAFDVTNVGIGSAPRGGAGFVYRIVDGNPSSATYGRVLNHCPTASPAIPTSGTYAAGHVVRNTSAALAGAGGSQYIVSGWYRATTGSSHVLNTDWREMRTLTGT